jgi:hypothetical protein
LDYQAEINEYIERNQIIEENKEHFGIIVVPQKNAYEVARRIGILVSALTADEIKNQLLYA